MPPATSGPDIHSTHPQRQPYTAAVDEGWRRGAGRSNAEPRQLLSCPPEPRVDRAVWAVIMEAFVHGVSTRKVDDLAGGPGHRRRGAQEPSQLHLCERRCGDGVSGAPAGPIEFPYVFVDATYLKAHDGARVVSKPIIVATGVAADGDRKVLGLAVGDRCWRRDFVVTPPTRRRRRRPRRRSTRRAVGPTHRRCRGGTHDRRASSYAA